MCIDGYEILGTILVKVRALMWTPNQERRGYFSLEDLSRTSIFREAEFVLEA